MTTATPTIEEEEKITHKNVHNAAKPLLFSTQSNYPSRAGTQLITRPEPSISSVQGTINGE